MNKFFNYYNYLCIGANTPSVFSYDPYITAIKEMLVSELQQIVYYIEKLKGLNMDMSGYRDKVIDFISILIVNLDFKKESFFVIIEDLYNNKKKLEELYINACKDFDGEPVLLAKEKENLSSKETILKALNEHEKNISDKKITLSENKKILYEIMINIVLNACNCLIELKHYGIDFPQAKDEVLKLFNSSNFPSDDDEKWKEKIMDFAKCNYKIVKLLNSAIIEKFGPVKDADVSLSKKKGKAILVSGTSLLELEKILKAAENTEINIYTHHEMISAFEYENLQKYPNLAGHYQRSNNNFPLDFAEFPGPIYISRSSIPKIDVIRGQIYTSAKYPAYGIGKIENDNFSPLIDYALEAKGFEENINYNSIKIGYSFDEVNKNIDLLSDKFKQGEIKHIFIIGLIDMFSSSNKYINEFLTECPEDYFIISFSYEKQRNNFWHVNSYYDFSIVYYIVEKLSEKIENPQKNISIILSDCNTNTISHIFNLMHLKIKNIFLGACCPNIINPVLVEGLSDLFNVKPLTSPIEDINTIIN